MLLHLRWAAATPVDDEWRFEAPGLFELFPDTAVVGGPVDHAGRLVAAGEVFGFGRGCDSPDVGRGAGEFGWMVTLPKQRSVSAVSPQHLVADAAFVGEALAGMPPDATVAGVGMWLGAHAARTGRRVVHSPHLGASVTTDLATFVHDGERSSFNRVNADLLPDTRVLSPMVGLERAGDLEPSTPEDRAAHVARLLAPPPAARPPYAEWLRARIADRASRFPIPATPPTFAVITPVYEGTPAALFDELAAALAAQTLPPTEWLVASDGPITPDLEARLRTLATANPRVRYLPGSRRGILATMRSALEAASADYITPIDADDLVTPDALHVLASVLVTAGRPALVYSDEDIVDAGGPRDPFLRPDWDPVLHHAGSYIWHLIAYDRRAALDARALTDQGSNWCHDWDTVDLLVAAGHRPVHVPEVLYHWRHHERSSTNTADPTAGSQQSVRHVMERMIARTAHPERYHVEVFPIHRGAREWYITRREIDPPAVGVVVTSADVEPEDSFIRSVARTCSLPLPEVRIANVDGTGWAAPVAAALRGLETDVVVVASDAIDLVRDGWLWEAVKLLELHPDVAVVTGRIVDAGGRIVAGGEVADPGSGELVAPLAGLTLADPGPYAFALKPQLVSSVTTRLFVADRQALLAALDAGAGDGPGLATVLAAAGRTVAYTPLIEARIGEPDPAPRAVAEPGPVIGLAGFDWGRRRFS
jgi:glycosyltransferase involved in cell wall biosynthesis